MNVFDFLVGLVVGGCAVALAVIAWLVWYFHDTFR